MTIEIYGDEGLLEYLSVRMTDTGDWTPEMIAQRETRDVQYWRPFAKAPSLKLKSKTIKKAKYILIEVLKYFVAMAAGGAITILIKIESNTSHIERSETRQTTIYWNGDLIVKDAKDINEIEKKIDECISE